MKKIVVFLILVVVAVSIFVYAYQNYVFNYNNAKRENRKFTIYTKEEILGQELPTLINKAMDSNARNEVEKDENGNYKDNELNSINIDIKFLENENQKKFLTYNMEVIYKVGVENLLVNYIDSTFKCSKVEYHKKTGQVKYMVFEQIT